VRIYLDGQVPDGGTTHEVPPQSGQPQVPLLDTYSQAPALAHFLEPLAQELAAARLQLVDLARENGQLRAQLAAAEASPAVDPPAPWWRRWAWWRSS
jgi:hypothetical protein